MTLQGRKPSVAAKTYREWLSRFESGETPPMIADAEGYDVRTVRKLIDRARQEQEVREARVLVLRAALEDHYRDIVEFCRKLSTRVRDHSNSPFTEKGDRMWRALGEHLPSPPIWRRFARWESFVKERGEIGRKVAHLADRWIVESNPSIQLQEHDGKVGLNVEGISNLVRHRLIELARHPASPLEPYPVETQSRPDDLVDLLCHSQWCAVVPKDQVQDVEELLQRLMSEVARWPEMAEMSRVVLGLDRETRALDEVLTTIRLKRVVSGSCRYCPT